ncbi:prepilin-type N-terminal cleavage/methylation domain-containing protein [Acinetobacter indicus]
MLINLFNMSWETMKNGFTLIELLIIVTIISILGLCCIKILKIELS